VGAKPGPSSRRTPEHMLARSNNWADDFRTVDKVA
jgi:hypothetical protein